MLNITKEEYDTIEAHGHAAYDAGGHADDIVRITFQRLGVLVDGKEVPERGFGYSHPETGEDLTV